MSPMFSGSNMADSWYYIRDGHSIGPLSRAQLIAEVPHATNWRQEQVWSPEYSDWREAGSVDELSSELAQSDLGQPALYHHDGSRSGSVLVTTLVYAGLAVLGMVSAIAYRLLF